MSNLAIDASDTATRVAPEALAAPRPTATCSICQWPMTAEEHVTACPGCGLAFHAECWTENRGCSAYGCSHVNVTDVNREVAESEPPRVEGARRGLGPIPSIRSPRPTAHDPRPAEARLSTGHVMLAASVAGAVLGLLTFGALPFVVLITSTAATLRRSHRRPSARGTTLLFIAIGVSLFGVCLGMAVSSMLWLGWSPGVSP